MNPKDKAQELVDMFGNGVSDLLEVDSLDVRYGKKMSLICVDEILKELYDIDDGQTEMPYMYWDKVKKEIEKI